MPRFFLPDLDSGRLDGMEGRHARKVLRLKPGDHCSLFDGCGTELHAEITEVGSASDLLFYRELSRRRDPPSPFCTCLFTAVTKAKSFNLIIEKAVELGISEIQPVLSSRSVVKLEPGDRNKTEKWHQDAIAACKQCGRNQLPKIHPVQTVNEAVAHLQSPNTLRLIASLQPHSDACARVLEQCWPEAGSLERIEVAVGPEGDFSPAELAAFLGSGFRPVHLGPLVLRAETAALYLCAVLLHETQRHQPPSPG